MAGLSGAGGGGGGSAIRAGRAFVSLFLENNQFLRGLKQVQSQAHAFGKMMAKAGAVTTAAGLAAVAPLKLVIDSIGDLAKQGEVAAGLGLTAEAFTGIAGVAKSVGEDTREFTESLVTLGKLGTDAAAGTEQAAAAFKALGLNANEFVKLGADEQFFTIFEALSKVQDPLQRTRLLMQAFGEDGGKYLLPLLEKSPDELRKMAKGFAVASDDMKAARESQAALSMATATLGKVWTQVVVALAPAIKDVAEIASKFLGPLAEIVSKNRELVVGAAAVAVAILAAGLAISGVGASFMLASAGISGLLALVGAVKFALLAIISPVGLAVLAVTALAAGLAYLWSTTEDGQGAIAQLKGGLGELVQTFSEAFAGISDALSVGDLALAGKIAFTALNLEFTKMLSFLTDRWNKWVGETFVDKWHEAIKLISLAMNDAVTWMQTIFTKLGQDIRKAIGESLTSVLKWGLEKYIKFLEFTDVLGSNSVLLHGAKSMMDGLTLSPEDIAAKLAAAEEERKKRAEAIKKDADDAKAARDKARGADKLALDEKIKRLEKELADLNDQAADDAWQQMLFDLTAPDKLKGAAGEAARIATETKGMFGGANAKQVFGVGSKANVAEKTLTATEKVAANTEHMAGRLDALDGLAFA